MKRVAHLLIVFAFYLLAPPALKSEENLASSVKKLPPPTAAESAAAVKVITGIYQKDMDAAKSPAQKSSVAQKLFDDGRDTADDPAGKFELYSGARKLAVTAGNAELAWQVIDQCAKEFEVDAFDLQRRVLVELSPLAKLPEDQYVIVRMARRLSRTAAAADNYKSALALAELAAEAARKMRDADMAKQAEAEVKRLTTAAAEFEKAGTSIARLQDAPEDPTANLAAGKYFCFVQGNWTKGIPMLALGNDTVLKTLAERDLVGAQDGAGHIALGDAWYEFAQTQEAALRPKVLGRAAYWYRLAPLAASGIAKVKIEKRLAEIDAAASPIKPGEWVELLDYVELPRDRMSGNWEWRNTALAIDKHEGAAGVLLPLVVNGSYTMRMRAVRDAKSDLAYFSLPFPGHQAMVIVNGYEGSVCSIWRINGIPGNDDGNPARSGGVSYTPGRPYTVDWKVEKSGENVSVQVALDGKRCLAWSGPISSLGPEEYWNSSRCGEKMLIGQSVYPITIHSVRFKLLSGTARLTE